MEEDLAELEEHGIRLRRPEELRAAARRRLERHFVREIAPVLTPLASLESLTVEEGGRTLEYVLSGGEETGEETGAGICLLNGEHISREAFDAAYDRLLTVTFSGVLPEGAKWEEPYKKYTLRTLSGGTHTIELRGWDGIHDAVTVDGATLFYLIRGGMTPLPGEEEGTY